MDVRDRLSRPAVYLWKTRPKSVGREKRLGTAYSTLGELIPSIKHGAPRSRRGSQTVPASTSFSRLLITGRRVTGSSFGGVKGRTHVPSSSTVGLKARSTSSRSSRTGVRSTSEPRLRADGGPGRHPQRDRVRLAAHRRVLHHLALVWETPQCLGGGVAVCLVIPAVAVAAAALAVTSTGSSAVVSAGSAGRIAYYRHLPPCRLDSQGGKVCSHGIWTGNLDGSAERRLTPLKLEVLYPEWSPNGDRIAVSGEYGASRGGRAVGDEGRRQREAEAADRRSVLVRIREPRIVLVARREDDHHRGVARRNPKRDPRKYPGRARRARQRRKAASAIRAAAGKVLREDPQPSALAQREIDRIRVLPRLLLERAVRLAFDGSSRKRLSSAYAADPGRALDWSPDRRRIVFARQVNNGGSLNPELHVINADGTGLRRLTITQGNNTAWHLRGRPTAARLSSRVGSGSMRLGTRSVQASWGPRPLRTGSRS